MAIEPGTPEAKAFERELMWLGRNKAPDRFLDAVIDGEISTELMRELILGVWCGAELPLRAIGDGEPETGAELWLTMFERTGFVADSDDLPDMPVTVYRGAPLDEPHGFSWSWSRDKAEWFANRYRGAFVEPCGIFSVTLERDHLLGIITGERGECEVIVNPEILNGDLEPELEDVLEPDDSTERTRLNTW